MTFFGRYAELEKLALFFDRAPQSLALVYGRRGVGKTRLIFEALSQAKCRYMFFSCRQTNEMDNTERFCAAIHEQLSLPRLAFSLFVSALEYLFEKACHELTVVVLDDYPNLRKHIENCDGVLQKLIDRYRGTSQLKLVLCGSAIEEMRSLTDGGNPIGQRIDLTLHLKAMDYEQASAFYPNFSNEDKIRLYSVFGGLPFFLRLIDSRLTVRENILKLISSSDSFCAITLQLFLASEFAKLESVNVILSALSKRPLKFSELLDETGIKSGAKMNYTLNKLCEMELIKKVSAESYSDNKRRTRYTITDNLVHYYFSFVDANLNRIATYGAEHTFDRFVADEFEVQFVPEVAKTIVV